MQIFRVVSLLAVALAAVVCDLCHGKIPNVLIGAGLVLGFFCQVYTLRRWGIRIFFSGAVIPVLFFAPLFYFRMIGAGDIKLLSVAGGYFGAWKVFSCILWAMFFAGVLALIRMYVDHSFRERMRFFFSYVSESVKEKKWEPYLEQVNTRAKIRLSIPVLLGIIVCLI